MLRESICEGTVVHRRYTPRRHQFRYPVLYVCFDLARLDDDLAGFGISVGAGQSASRVRADLDATLRQHGHAPPNGRVLLLAQPAFKGRRFNPVVFYFYENPRGVEFIVAEITNTPWDETHRYVLPVATADRELRDARFAFDKTFHVSPFAPMDLRYEWRFAVSNDCIRIGMWLTHDHEPYLFAGMRLQCEPLDVLRMATHARRYPLQNMHTLARIYWQALRLWIRRTPFYAHPSTGE